MINKSTLISVALLFTATKGFAQRPAQGFVLTSANDTIRGELFQSESDARKQVVHIKPSDQVAASYTAGTIKGFGQPDRPLIESKTYGPSHTPILVEMLIQGPVRLYKGYHATAQDTRRSESIRYYLQLSDSAQLVLVEPTPLVLSLNRLLGDCLSTELSKQITAQPKSYNSRILSQAVNEYSACRYSIKPTQPKSPFRGWYTSWGAKAGIKYSQLRTAEQFVNLGDARSDNTLSWQAGVFGNLAYWNGFAVQAELLFSRTQSKFSQSVYSGTSLYTISRKADFTSSQVRLPLLLRYQAGRGLLRPFVLAGPHINYEISHTATVEDKRSDQSASTMRQVVWPSRIGFGLQGGGGVYLALPKLPGISVETVYARGQQGTSKIDNIVYKDLSFSAAIYF